LISNATTTTTPTIKNRITVPTQQLGVKANEVMQEQHSDRKDHVLATAVAAQLLLLLLAQ
jgi:hypothetical protein